MHPIWLVKQVVYGSCSVSLVGMALPLMCVVQTNLIRVSQHCISRYFHSNSHLIQLYVSNRIDHLVIKVGVACVGVVCVSRYLKEELAWTTDKGLWVISNIMALPLGN